MGAESGVEGMAGLNGAQVLVSGGAGFIGGHLVAELIKMGARVVVVDIAINPKSTFVSDKIYKDVKLELVDIRDKDEVSRVYLENKPSYVFHLAAEPLVEAVIESPHSAFETNIMGTVNMLEAARSLSSLKNIIIASSDKAYGKTKTAYSEDSPLRGDHPYDVSKSAADLISNTYFKSYNLPVSITRFGNVYGEGDLHLGRIIPGICEAIIRNKTLEIRSNGKFVRDYLYVKDVVDGYIFLTTNKSFIGEAYNFASSDSLTVLDVIKLAEKVLMKKISIKIINNAKNEIPFQHLNDSKIRKQGWKSKHLLENTLPKILLWYEKML